MLFHSVMRARVRLGFAMVVVCVVVGTAHANDVVVTAAGGTLTVKGDDDANALRIEGAPSPGVLVTPLSGTTVNGSTLPQTFPDAGTTLKVTLAAGDDTLTLASLAFTGKATLNLGAGADTLATTNVQLGALKLDLGDGDDVLTSTGLSVTGALALKGGKGNDEASFESTLADTMKAGLGDGTDAMALCDAHVAHGIAVDLGPGATGGVTSTKSCGGTYPATASAFEGNSLAASGISIGAGGLSVKGGKGNDSFASSIMAIHGDVKVTLGDGRGGFSMCQVAITGSVKAKLGKPGVGDTTSWCRKASAYDVTVTAQTLFVVAELSVGGDFQVKSATGNDAGAALYSVFNGLVKLDLGAGMNNATLGTDMFGDDLVIKTGKQADVVHVLGSQVVGNGVITVGDGTNDVLVSGTTFGGNLGVKSGTGDDTIDVSTAIVTGTRTVDADGGTNTVTE